MSDFILLMVPITFAIICFGVPDPVPKRDPAKLSLKDLQTIIGNHHLRRVLSADFLLSAALGITGSLYVWFTVYVLEMPSLTSVILVAYFGAATFCVPIWMRLARKYEKHTVFAGAMAYGMVTLGLFSLTPGAPLGIVILVNCLYGCAYGAGVFLARAMVADTADYDEAKTGVSRMGTFYSGLTLTAKTGFAFGPMVAYNLLEWVGFDPKGTVDAAASNWLLFTFTVPSIALLGCAGLIIRGHRLTRAEHARIRQQLDHGISR